MWWTKKKRNKPDYSNRDKHQRFYQSANWQRLRLHQLSIEPLCQECLKTNLLTEATVVDHILSLTDDYSKRLDPDNIQSLCETCHNQKSSNERWCYHQERLKGMIDDMMNELEEF